MITASAERWQFKPLHFHNWLPKLVTFLPLITGNYWLLGGSIVKPITSFYGDLTTNYLKEGRHKQWQFHSQCFISLLNEISRFWITFSLNTKVSIMIKFLTCFVINYHTGFHRASPKRYNYATISKGIKSP